MGKVKFTGKRIVVIDDDPDIFEFCNDTLSHLGYQLIHINKAENGLSAIDQYSPVLVILDMMIEEPDSGLKLASKLTQRFPNLPVILYSSLIHASEELMSPLLFPVRRVLQKPIPPDQLIAEVEDMLGISSKEEPEDGLRPD